MLSRHLRRGSRLLKGGKYQCASVSVAKRSASHWANVEVGPEDPILGITVAFNNDTDPRKINLGVGAYRDDNGKPFVLDSVKQATKKVLETPGENHEYLPIGGDPTLCKLSAELLLGSDSPVLKDKRYITLQTLSGTGALRVATEFMSRFYTQSKTVYVPNPTWANHHPLIKDSNLKLANYSYYSAQHNGLNFPALVKDLQAAPDGSIVLLHACAHNPTGQDPTQQQWQELVPVFKSKNLLPFFDSAYQGFASGDTDQDAFAIRLFVKNGLNPVISQSYAKNFGLYGERVGTTTFVTENADQAKAIESQLKILVRPIYSNPPKFGARIVAEILKDAQLKSLWKSEVKGMADRIIGMRSALVSGLKNAGSTKDWSHVTSQIGMFCYSGLTGEQVDRLAKDYHIYMTRNGRISMAGVTTKNVDYLAKSMHAVSS
eukprot:TRINITY_DN21762_c0_g1_i1.p1 TRINITY_DN21762_c0_g1~~TRINITY_DN21762_c0_g1_i1.p1  ORF type:complete len:432 (+),score=103.40 TRINITY_DN21762_c0_g1_i1:65-1360(+)